MFRVPTYQLADGNLQHAAMAVGDFNGDGRSDLVVAMAAVPPGEVIDLNVRDTLSILPGRDDGTFGAPIPLEPGPHPQAVVVGDFNGDGRQDLALANAYTAFCLPYIACPPPPDGYLSIRLGAGNGTFGHERRFAVGQGPDAMAAGDFNEDGRQDLAVANGRPGGAATPVGLGAGSFWPGTRVAGGA